MARPLSFLTWCMAAWLAMGFLASAARAQVPPSAAEAARYIGLLAAAHKKLLAAGASVNERDSHGRTAVHVAAFARQRDVLRALAQAGANLELLENDRYDAVTVAAVADDEETLRVLLALGASAKQTTSRYDGTALIAAAHLGHDGVVRQLIAVIEAIVLGNGGARHQAVLRGLLEAGASTRQTDREGNTPLTLARARGYVTMVAMLEKAAAK